MKKRVLGTVVGAVAALLFSGSAWSLPCITGSVAAYMASGFSCDVGTLTFSNFNVQTTGDVVLGNFSPIILPGIVTGNGQVESGFQLNYSANTTGPGTSADVTIHYIVQVMPGAPLIDDAYMSLTGGTGGDGARITLAETLSPNNVGLFLNGNGFTFAEFAPISALFAIKDQNDFAGLTFATSSALVDAFSQCVPGTPGCVVNPPTNVPEPTSLILLGTALIGLGAAKKFRRRQPKAALAA